MYDLNSLDSSKPETLWSKLGTYYFGLGEDDKKHINAYWEALARMGFVLNYDLEQISNFLSFSLNPGWREVFYNKFNIVFSSEEDASLVNTFKEYLSSPKNLQASSVAAGTRVYAYRVSAYNSVGETLASKEVVLTQTEAPTALLPITLTWSAVEGATGYKVYGGGVKNTKLLKTVVGATTYEDDGSVEDPQKDPATNNSALSAYIYALPKDDLYMAIPQLIEGEDTVLTVETDFTVIELNKLRLPVTSINPIENKRLKTLENTYTYSSAIVLNNLIPNLYLSSFGKTTPTEILTSLKYLPHTQEYVSSSDYETKRKLYAEHLKYWVWAYSHFLRKKPSVSNIIQLYALVKDYPFAYESGIVSAITSSTLTITEESGDRTYIIGAANTPAFTEGDSVNKFDILIEGISLKDYHTDPSIMESLATDEEEPRLMIQLTSTATGFNEDADIVDNFRKLAIPAGLNVKL